MLKLHLIKLAFVIATGLLAWPAIAYGDDSPIEAFFGTYKGTSIPSNADDTAREIIVSIKPTASGFNVSWQTAKRKSDRRLKEKTYSINFERTKRDSIFGSAMRRDKFGERVPLNPLKGDPYVWARITEKTLTVYALLITSEGSYQMQVYHRTLTEEGLHLEFTRFGEGESLKTVDAELKKVDK